MSLQVAPTLPEPAPTLGGRIRQARSYQRLSQDALIERMISLGAEAPTRRTLSDFENDKRSPQVRLLQAIAAVTQFPIAWFVIDLRDDAGPSDDEPAPATKYAPRDSNPEPADYPIVPLTRRVTPLRLAPAAKAA